MRFAFFITLSLLGFILTGCEDVGWQPGTPAMATSSPSPTTPSSSSTSSSSSSTPTESSGLPAPGSSVEISNSDGPGGFVNNPDNSRNTLKIIFPNLYSGHITEVIAVTADGKFRDALTRATPDEGGDRQRYYGTLPLSSYPNNLIVTAYLDNNSSVYVQIPNPKVRYD